MTTVHTYVRCVNKIYICDAADQWRELHSFETEKRAKRWQRDQEKKRPGSVEARTTHPVVAKHQNLYHRAMLDGQACRREIAKLISQQAADQARHSPKSRPETLSGKTAQLARTYVAPDRDASSFLRERSKKRVTSRNARNTRATYGGS